MDIHRHSHMDRREISRESPKGPGNAGLWKLLVAAALILLALVAAMEFFGDAGSDIVAPRPPQQSEAK